MRESDLRAAIIEPARLARLEVEPALVQILVQELSGNPGALPMLSHALQETWQRREGRTLTVASYQASGGIREAVARSAEAIYSSIPVEQQSMLRTLLLRLVAPGPDGDPVPSRMPRRLVVTGPEHEQLVDLLVGSRLVTSDDGVVQIAHEALAREWPRLRDWLEEDVEGQRILHHLAEAADSWDVLGRPSSELYRGVRLAKAQDWLGRATPTLSDAERDFLDNSEALADAELHNAEDRARQQSLVNRRLRGLLALAVATLLVAVSVGLYALRQANRAEQAAMAEKARGLGTLALPAADIGQALLLALQGVRMADSPETRSNLFAAMASQPHLIRSAPAAGGNGRPEVSPDGERIAVPDDQGGVHLYDAATSRLLHSYQPRERPESEAWTSVAFSPENDYLAVGSHAVSRVQLLDARTLAPTGPALEIPHADGAQLDFLDFAANGRYLAASMGHESTAGGKSFTVVWDLESAAPQPDVVHTDSYYSNVAVLSPDGRTLYTSFPLAAYDVASSDIVWSTKIHPWGFDISPDGKLLASVVDVARPRSSRNPSIRLTDAHTGQTIQVLRGVGDALTEVRFLRETGRLATFSHDGRLIIWNLAAAEPLLTLDTFEGNRGMTLSPDAHRLYTLGPGTLRTWDLYGDAQYLHRIVAPERKLHVIDVQPSPGGDTFAYLSTGLSGSRIGFVNTATGTTIRAQVPGTIGSGRFESVPTSLGTWRPDGRHYAVVTSFGVIRVLDAATGEVIARRTIGGFVSSLAYVDSGRRLMVADNINFGGTSAGNVLFLNAETLETDSPYYNFTATCCGVGAPQGGTAMVFDDGEGVGDGSWRVIDTGSGHVLKQGTLSLGTTSAAFSPDGTRVAVTGLTGEVVTIDVSSGRVSRATAPGQSAEGYWVRWSQDGSRIVSGAADGSVSLWDGDSLDLLGKVQVPDGGVPASPAFTGEDEVTLAAYDGQVYRWDTDFNHTLAFACQMAGRNLTASEWQRAIPDRAYEKTCFSG